MVLLALPEQITIDGTGLFDLGLVAVPVSGFDEVPPVRGDDAPYTGLDGAQYLRKLRDSTTFVLHIYAFGSDSDGLVLTTDRRHARANLDTLYTLLAAPAQRTVSRVMPDGSVRDCLAEVIRVERAPDPTGGALFSLVATFRNAEGKWYGEGHDSSVDIPTTAYQFPIVVGGTVETVHSLWVFNGTLSSPRVVNQTTGAWFEATGVVTGGGGQTLVVDAATFSARQAGIDRSGSITHGGAVPFMVMAPGLNQMTVSTFVAGGTVAWLINPAYH